MYNPTALSTDRKRFRIARDEEFIRAYNEALSLMIRRGVAHPRRSAIRFTIYNTQPRYHVSFERAYVVVCRLLRLPVKPVPQTLRGQMWLEIASRVAMLVDDRQVSIAAALEFVLANCRASRFFVSEQYADSRIDAMRRHQASHLRKPLTRHNNH